MGDSSPAHFEQAGTGHFEQLGDLLLHLSGQAEMTNRNPSRQRAVARKLDPVDVRIQYEFVQMITEHLSDLWVSFDGDIGETLVLGVIGQAQLGAKLGEKEPTISVADESRGVSASSIADVTGIPRQTVRRKLIRLKERGLIHQDDHHRWSLVVLENGTIPAHEKFADLYQRGLERAKRLAITLKPYV